MKILQRNYPWSGWESILIISEEEATAFKEKILVSDLLQRFWRVIEVPYTWQNGDILEKRSVEVWNLESYVTEDMLLRVLGKMTAKPTEYRIVRKEIVYPK